MTLRRFHITQGSAEVLRRRGLLFVVLLQHFLLTKDWTVHRVPSVLRTPSPSHMLLGAKNHLTTSGQASAQTCQLCSTTVRAAPRRPMHPLSTDAWQACRTSVCRGDWQLLVLAMPKDPIQSPSYLQKSFLGQDGQSSYREGMWLALPVALRTRVSRQPLRRQ